MASRPHPAEPRQNLNLAFGWRRSRCRNLATPCPPESRGLLVLRWVLPRMWRLPLDRLSEILWRFAGIRLNHGKARVWNASGREPAGISEPLGVFVGSPALAPPSRLLGSFCCSAALLGATMFCACSHLSPNYYDDHSRSTCSRWRRKDLASSLGLSLDDFNQRIKVHDHLANLVLQFLQQQHATLMPSTQTEDMVKKFNDLNRAHELLQAQYSASLRASTSPTVPTQKDDAELVTPPPTNHTQSSSPTSSLPTVCAAALDGKSFGSAVQPRIIQSLHGLSSPPSRPAASQLLTMRSTPEDVIKYYTWTSDQPRLYLKQSPTTTTVASDQVGQSPIPSQRQQVLGIHVDPALSAVSTHPKRRRAYVWGDGGSVGTGAWLPHQAHWQGVVSPHRDCPLTHRVSSCLRSLMSPEWQLCHD